MAQFYIIFLLLLHNSFISCTDIDDIIFYNVIKEIQRVAPTQLHVQNYRRRRDNLVRPSGYVNTLPKTQTNAFWGNEGPVKSVKIRGPTINLGKPVPSHAVYSTQYTSSTTPMPSKAVYYGTQYRSTTAMPSYGQSSFLTSNSPFASLFQFDKPDPIPQNPFVKKGRVKKSRANTSANFSHSKPSAGFRKLPSRKLRRLSSQNGNLQTKNTNKCKDKHAKCRIWAKQGECSSNAYWMKPNCQSACRSCGATVETINKPNFKPRPGCTNNYRLCAFWADDGECEKNEDFMSQDCRLSCSSLVTNNKNSFPIDDPLCDCSFPTEICSTSALITDYEVPDFDAASLECAKVPPACQRKLEEFSITTRTPPTSTVRTTARPPVTRVTRGQPGSQTTSGVEDDDSRDYHSECCWWAMQGMCQSNYQTRTVCQKSCGTKWCRIETASDCSVTVDVSHCPQNMKTQGGTSGFKKSKSYGKSKVASSGYRIKRQSYDGSHLLPPAHYESPRPPKPKPPPYVPPSHYESPSPPKPKPPPYVPPSHYDSPKPPKPKPPPYVPPSHYDSPKPPKPKPPPYVPPSSYESLTFPYSDPVEIYEPPPNFQWLTLPPSISNTYTISHVPFGNEKYQIDPPASPSLSSYSQYFDKSPSENVPSISYSTPSPPPRPPPGSPQIYPTPPPISVSTYPRQPPKPAETFPSILGPLPFNPSPSLIAEILGTERPPIFVQNSTFERIVSFDNRPEEVAFIPLDPFHRRRRVSSTYPKKVCVDLLPHCLQWAHNNGCRRNPRTKIVCPKSCKNC